MIRLKKTRPFPSLPISSGKPSDLIDYFKIRPAEESDLAFCYSLTTSLAKSYLDDFEQLNLPWIKSLIQSGNLYCIDYIQKQKNIPAGLIWLADIRIPVSVELHFLIAPEWMRKARQQLLFSQVIDFTFKIYPVYKIKALCKETQSTAIQLLRRLHFKLVGYFPNDTLIKGQWTNQLAFELTRSLWQGRTEQNINGEYII